MPQLRAERERAPGSGWFHVADRLFLTLLVLSVASHFGLIAAVAGRTPDAPDELQEVIPDAWHPFIAPRDAKPSPLRVSPQPSRAGPAAPARRTAPAPKLDRVGLIGVIGAMTGEAGSGIGDLLKAGGGPLDIDRTFRGLKGLGAARSDMDLHDRRGAGTGAVAGLDELGTNGPGQVDLGHTRGVAVASTVAAEVPEPESKTVDRDGLSRFVKAHGRAIQTCYERQLKLLPNLRGKLAVRLTLTPAGRVGDLEVDEDTLQNDAVVDCIRSVVRGWQLPFRPEADAALQLSWSFVAGG